MKPFKNRVLIPYLKVDVYRNLIRKMWSVRQNGIIIGHCTQIYLWGCDYIVGEGGRQRVLRERVKNVHAYVRGYVCEVGDIRKTDPADPADPDGYQPYHVVTYNPYKYDSFVDKKTEARIMKSDFCDMDIEDPFGDYVLAINK